MSVLVVRHGTTLLNAKGDSQEAIRGWLDIPLAPDGMEDVANTAQALIGMPISRIHCSDLVRAVQTAQEIAGAMRMPINATPVFRPWNVGDMAGKPLTAVHDDMMRLVLEDPKEKAPNGESFQNFLDRYLPCIIPLVKAKALYLVITHARNIMVLEGLCMGKGKAIDPAPLDRACSVEPGGVVYVSDSWSFSAFANPKPYLYRALRVNKTGVLYIHKKDTDYQCKDCLLYVPHSRRCEIHGPGDDIGPLDTCGLFVMGTPQTAATARKPSGSVTKLQSGYTKHKEGFSCKRCEYFLSAKQDCQKVDPDSEGDDPGIIHADGCCNLWAPQER